MRELYEYDGRLRKEMNCDYCTFAEMVRSYHGKDRKLLLDYPLVLLKAQEGDRLACRFASIYSDVMSGVGK